MTADDELRALAQAATPGPWTTGDRWWTAKQVNTPHGGLTRTDGSMYGTEMTSSANAAFIAAANPASVIALLDRLARAEAIEMAARALTDAERAFDVYRDEWETLRAALAVPAGGQTYVTKTGKVLTDADIEALSEEAARGYVVGAEERS